MVDKPSYLDFNSQLTSGSLISITKNIRNFIGLAKVSRVC
jgi:hypothetical protein